MIDHRAAASVVVAALAAASVGRGAHAEPTDLDAASVDWASASSLSLLEPLERPALADSAHLGVGLGAFIDEEKPADAAGGASGTSTSDLAKAAQNPVADMISLPFQNNTYFGIGPDGDDVANVLNIQPVYPINLSEQWNVITRTIVPIVYVPDLTPGLPGQSPGGSSEFGLGDIQFTAFLSPAKPKELIWGLGPVFRFPTATDELLGARKWSAGPSAVALRSHGHWTYGALAQNLWSFAGSGDQSVNQLLIQPFVNYNMADGWYLTSAPIITANWEVSSDDRWTVPIGGGIGKIFHLGHQPMNAQLQAFYNVETPDAGPEWTLRFQIQLLFPR